MDALEAQQELTRRHRAALRAALLQLKPRLAPQALANAMVQSAVRHVHLGDLPRAIRRNPVMFAGLVAAAIWLVKAEAAASPVSKRRPAGDARKRSTERARGTIVKRERTGVQNADSHQPQRNKREDQDSHRQP